MVQDAAIPFDVIKAVCLEVIGEGGKKGYYHLEKE